MINGTAVDAIACIYIGYACITGFKKGFFNVCVDVFGIYGALVMAWLFQEKCHALAIRYFGVSPELNAAIVFVVVWVLIYAVIRVFSTLLTSAFKLTGLSLMLRLAGVLLNAIRAIVIVVIVLTFAMKVNQRAIELTPMTTMFTHWGSSIMSVVSTNLDEHAIQTKNEPDKRIESVIIDDDFRYNLLKR